MTHHFNVPPGWPAPPPDWVPQPGWTPDPAWPAAPDGWVFWLQDDREANSNEGDTQRYVAPARTMAEAAPVKKSDLDVDLPPRGAGKSLTQRANELREQAAKDERLHLAAERTRALLSDDRTRDLVRKGVGMGLKVAARSPHPAVALAASYVNKLIDDRAESHGSPPPQKQTSSSDDSAGANIYGGGPEVNESRASDYAEANAAAKLTQSAPPPADNAQTRVACEDCRYFRPASSIAAPVVDALSPALRARAAQPIAAAIQQEQALAGGEYAVIDNRIAQGVDLHIRRPTTRSYCGIHETSNLFYLAEVKNALDERGDLKCKDGKPSPADPPERACNTCLHHRRPAHDVLPRLEELFSRGGVQGMTIYNERVRSVLEVRMQTELLQAVTDVGRLIQKPLVLPHCEHFSSDVQYVVGEVVNPADDCAAWKAAKGSPEADTMRDLDARWRAVQKKNETYCKYIEKYTAKGGNIIFDSKHHDMASETRKAALGFAEAALLALNFEAHEAKSVTRNLNGALANGWNPDE